MRPGSLVASALLALACSSPVAASGPAPAPAEGGQSRVARWLDRWSGSGTVTPEDIGRALEELAGMVRRLGAQARERFTAPLAERPLISLMLLHRDQLGLSAGQVESLERLRADFARHAREREADIGAAERELSELLAADQVDLGRVEASLRQIEGLRAELRLERLRTIERGKARLTPGQLSHLRDLVQAPSVRRPSAPGAGDQRRPGGP